MFAFPVATVNDKHTKSRLKRKFRSLILKKEYAPKPWFEID